MCVREERIPIVLRLMVKKRERWKKKPPSLVVGVAYIECATPSPLMLHGGASMP